MLLCSKSVKWKTPSWSNINLEQKSRGPAARTNEQIFNATAKERSNSPRWTGGCLASAPLGPALASVGRAQWQFPAERAGGHCVSD